MQVIIIVTLILIFIGIIISTLDNHYSQQNNKFSKNKKAPFYCQWYFIVPYLLILDFIGWFKRLWK